MLSESLLSWSVQRAPGACSLPDPGLDVLESAGTDPRGFAKQAQAPTEQLLGAGPQARCTDDGGDGGKGK